MSVFVKVIDFANGRAATVSVPAGNVGTALCDVRAVVGPFATLFAMDAVPANCPVVPLDDYRSYVAGTYSTRNDGPSR